jgi:segregation and condensation protein B
MRTLVSRGLVEEAGSDGESGAFLYRTTAYFLERLGLRSLDELPQLASFLPDLPDLPDPDAGSSVDNVVDLGVAGLSDSRAADPASARQ